MADITTPSQTHGKKSTKDLILAALKPSELLPRPGPQWVNDRAPTSATPIVTPTQSSRKSSNLAERRKAAKVIQDASSDLSSLSDRDFDPDVMHVKETSKKQKKNRNRVISLNEDSTDLEKRGRKFADKEKKKPKRAVSSDDDFPDLESRTKSAHKEKNNHKRTVSSDDDSTEYKTPIKSAKKQKQKQPRKRSPSEGEFVDESSDVDALARDKTRRRSQSLKKKPGETSTEAKARQARNAAKNRRRPGAGSHLIKNEDGTPVQAKVTGTKVPTTYEEAGRADRMMFKLKNEGKGWDEIRRKWYEITGILVGHSTLSVRYIKLYQNLANNDSAGDLKLIKYKKEVEEDLWKELWERVAAKIKADGGHDFSPETIAKRYAALEKNGFKLTEGAPRTEVEHSGDDLSEELDRNLLGLDYEDIDGENSSATEVDDEVQEAMMHSLEPKLQEKMIENDKAKKTFKKADIFGLGRQRGVAAARPLVAYGSSDENSDEVKAEDED